VAIINVLGKSSHILFSSNKLARYKGINYIFLPEMRVATNTSLLLMVICFQMFGFMALLITIGKSTPS
nr:hypothetical protein [Alphaproteobacteria bacterium]